jgi:hypothetical protein
MLLAILGLVSVFGLQKLMIILSITLAENATHTDLPAVYQALKIE